MIFLVSWKTPTFKFGLQAVVTIHEGYNRKCHLEPRVFYGRENCLQR